MYLNIVFLPLLGSFFGGLFGRFLGPYGSGIITTTCVMGSLLTSCFAFYEVGFSGAPCYITLLTWFNSEYLCADWGFMFDFNSDYANRCYFHFEFSSFIF